MKNEIQRICKVLLFLFVIIIVINYAKVTNTNKEVYINNKQVKLQSDILEIGPSSYISLDDAISIFNEKVFYDKISREVIICNYDNLIQLSLSDKEVFMENNEKTYINLRKLAKYIESQIYITDRYVCILDLKTADANILKDRVEVFDYNNNVIALTHRKDKVKVIIDDTKTKSLRVPIIIERYGETILGEVYSNNISFEKQLDEIKEKERLILVKAEESVKSSTNLEYVDIVSINALRLSNIDNVSQIQFELKKEKDVKYFAGFNNGQIYSNYDANIVSNMLRSRENRKKVIQSILDFLNKYNFDGVTVSFSNFKIQDDTLFIQFIKELSATMHENNKGIIVDISDEKFLEIAKVVDFVIVKGYDDRKANSKISLALSSEKKLKDVVEKIKNKSIDTKKVIIELNTNSVLWTERNGTIIQMEEYSMPLVKEYLEKNNLQTSWDDNSMQDYLNYTKGITTFKMWIENTESIKKKLELLTEENIFKISLYKSGLEEKSIYEVINNILSK